ncbi:MAG: SIS domain-containing protein [Chitinophagaceae bacterium]|nr:SIS domain-containing protein [Chitinophagaceae bacterium]
MKELHVRDQWYTGKEVAHQPVLWQETLETVISARQQLSSFLKEVYATPGLQIILTGAGSSAYIGEILQYSFQQHTGLQVSAVATTDLVTHPETFFSPSVPLLLVSFARSGDSPESVATLQLAEKLSDAVSHLVITCNAEGRLAQAARTARRAFVFLLPAASNDQALAMTSSFTCMSLAGLLIADIANVAGKSDMVRKLMGLGRILLDKYAPELDVLTDLDVKRVVFLGSGPLKGAARESHLKVIELTDGQVNCQYDSFLGFRHGPKAIIDDHTVMVYLFSNDPYVRKYELDLVGGIARTERFLYSLGVGQGLKTAGGPDLHLSIELGLDGWRAADDVLAVCSVIPAQLIGFYRSLKLGLNPDAPSRRGGIHRVVQGVNIYPYKD